MSLKFRIAYNTLIQFVGRFVTSLLGFITTLILARAFGASGYGVYSKIYTLVAFFFLLIDFGLNAVYVRKYKSDLSHLSQVFKLRTYFFLFSLILIGLFLIISGTSVFKLEEKYWLLVFTPVILLFGYFTTFNIIFQLKLRYDFSVVSGVLGGLVGLFLLIWLVRFGLLISIVSLVIGYLVTVLLAWYLASRFYRFSGNQFLGQKTLILFKEAFPLGVMLFLNTVYTRADVFVLAAFQGDKAVGIYSLAYKFFEFPLAFAAFFSNAIFPHYVKTYQENRSVFWLTYKKATIYLILVSFVFTLGGVIIAPFLRLIKADYVLSIQPLQILVLSYPVFFATSALSWLIFILKKEKYLIIIYGLSFLINIISNLFLVPEYSYLASSWITIFGEILVLIMLSGFLLIKKHPRHSARV